MSLKKYHVVFLFCCLTFYSHSLIGQEKKPVFACGYKDGDYSNAPCDFVKMSAYAPNADVTKAVKSIVNQSGLKPNFALLSCPDAKNAYAITWDDGIRYIVYDPIFVQRLGDEQKDWKAYSILAHELGHHLQGHTLAEIAKLEVKRMNELEADEYSGYVLQRLGATLEEAQAMMNEIGFEGNDLYSSHPNKEKRLKAIAEGFERAGGSQNTQPIASVPSTETHFNQGLDYMETQHLKPAVQEFNNSIEMNANNIPAYFYRATVKRIQLDYTGAIVDLTKAIQLQPKLYEAYELRGRTYYKTKDYMACINDLNVALANMDNSEALTYFTRGRAKEKTKDLSGAFSDISVAIALSGDAQYYVARGVIQEKQGNYPGAIADYTAAINADSELKDAYYNRASCYLRSENYAAAIADYQVLMAKGETSSEIDMYMGMCYYKVKDYQNGILTFSKVISAEPNNGEAFFFRAQCYDWLGQYDKASPDYYLAIAMGYNNPEVYFTKANLHYRQNELDMAITDLSVAIANKPDFSNALYLRGIVYRKQEKIAESCADFEKACALGNLDSCNEKLKCN